MLAQDEGADYIGIGPVFHTPLKPKSCALGVETVRQLRGVIKIPYFAIGNINESNIEEITAAGVKRIAVCRAILEADNPKAAAKRLYKKLIKL